MKFCTRQSLGRVAVIPQVLLLKCRAVTRGGGYSGQGDPAQVKSLCVREHETGCRFHDISLTKKFKFVYILATWSRVEWTPKLRSMLVVLAWKHIVWSFWKKKQNKHVIRKSYIYISTQRYSPSTCAVEKRGEKLPRARGHHENNEWWDSSDDIKIKTNKKNAFKSASTVEIQKLQNFA